MKKAYTPFWPLLVTAFIALPAHSQECPQIDDNAPLCPTSGTTLLDDTYPVQSYVISMKGFKKTKESDNTPVQFVETVAESYAENMKNMPRVQIATTDDEDFKELKEKVRINLTEKNFPKADIDRALSLIIQSKIPAYTWQQDHFESFFDPSTGRPVLRKVADYDSHMGRNTGSMHDLADKQCGVAVGDDLVGQPTNIINSQMGGNIEGLPGGFCLVGDNQPRDYTKSFCKNDDNIVNVTTSWLSVGHVDEIFKIVPTAYNDGRPKECQFALMAASPKKALEIMKSPQGGKETIFDFDRNMDPNELSAYLMHKPTVRTAVEICNSLLRIPEKNHQNASPDPKSKNVFLKSLQLFLSNAYAGATPARAGNRTCEDAMKSTNNYDFANALTESENFNTLNNAIQKSIDSDTAKIKAKISERLPQCAKYFDSSVLQVPNLFGSKAPATYQDKMIKDAYNTNSIYPNPSNSVVMNKTILFPDPENKAFSDYLKDEMKKRGLKFKAVKTWDYAHIGNGNIHCSSHTLNYCRPTK